MKDTLQIIKDSINLSLEVKEPNILQNDFSNINWWLLFSIFELIVILILIYKLKSKKKVLNSVDNFQELKHAKKSNIDMADLMKSINHSKDIYKELSKKCHPDRFEDEIEKTKAEEIFQKITRNKHDYKKLQELKALAIKQLNITFKNN